MAISYRDILVVKFVRYLPFLPIGVFAFIFLYFGNTGQFPGWANYPAYLTTICVTLLVQFIIDRNNKWLDNTIQWKRSVGGRFIIGFFLNFLVLISISVLASIIYFSISDLFEVALSEYGRIYLDDFIKLLIVSATVTLLYSVSYFAFFSFHSYSKGEIEQIELRRNQLELQLEVLRSQLSPHYLFNSLNTISSLIYKDAELAEEFIRRLAQSYHYILSNNEKISVDLSEEVEFVKSYHYLLKVRFMNNITLNINLEDDVLASKIPPLTLQMLVENAVKHNIITQDTPLTINITSNVNSGLTVSNSKTSQNGSANSLHIGLENIRRRYSYLTKGSIKIYDKDEFRVELPLIGVIVKK